MSNDLAWGFAQADTDTDHEIAALRAELDYVRSLADGLARDLENARDSRASRALDQALGLLAAEMQATSKEWLPPERVQRRNAIRALLVECGRAPVGEWETR